MGNNKFKLGILLYTILSFSNLQVSYAQSIATQQAAKATSAGENNVSILTNLVSADILINLIFAIIILAITLALSKVLPKIITAKFEKFLSLADAGNGEELIGVVNRMVSVFVLFIGFSGIMSVLGLDMTIFIGGLGFGIGFTLKVFLSNFIAGIIMVTQGTYHNGDLIMIEGNMGRIDKIYSLYTRIKQFDGVIYLVPNLKFLEENVRNYNLNDKRRIEVQVQVTYETDIYKAKQILVKVAQKFPNLLKAPEPSVLVDELAENGINLQLRAWINAGDSYLKTKSNLTETINLAFRQQGITIPYKNITILDNKIEA